MPKPLTALLLLVAVIALNGCRAAQAAGERNHNYTKDLVADDGAITRFERIGYLEGCAIYRTSTHTASGAYVYVPVCSE